MHKPFAIAGASLAALAVGIGAFGAHGLEKITNDPKILHGFDTAVTYQMYHALALLILSLIAGTLPSRLLLWAGRCFLAGVILFSGSIYLLSLLKIQGSDAVKFVGPVTPLGGLFFIVGWIMVIAGVSKKIQDR